MASIRSLLPNAGDLAAIRRAPRLDVTAGITVAVVALPLALAFGVSSGLGAQAGLATAIVAGLVAAVSGGSNVQVSGPTGAMAVVLLPVVHHYGPGGALLAGFLAGAVLVALAVLRVGRYVRYLPLPVIEGFTAGIAVVIALQQVPAALGVQGGDSEHVLVVAAEALTTFAGAPHVASVAMALAVCVVLLLGARWRPGVPFSLLAVAIATAGTAVADLPVAVIGPLPSALPLPSFGFFTLDAIPELLTSACAIAALAALESLLSATVADGMVVTGRHDPDRELFGQGLANLAAPLFGGVPATGAIARTAVNVRAGAVSRAASATHAIVLALFVIVGAGLVEAVPLPALAGVLLATTVRMVDPSAIRGLLRATPGDAATLVLTFVVTVTVNLVSAVAVGVVLAMVFALRTIAQSATFDTVDLDRGDHTQEEHELLRDRIVAYRPEGPLFFGAANRFLAELTDVGDVDVVILRMSRITAIDATGAAVLGDAIAHLEHRGVPVLLSGITTGHEQVLAALRIGPMLRARGHLFQDTPSAIFYARTQLVRRPGPRVDRAVGLAGHGV